MSTVTYCQVNNFRTISCNFNDKIKDKLTIENKIKKEDIISVFTNEKKHSLGTIMTGQNKVGNAEWIVLYKSPEFDNTRYDALEQSINELKNETNQLRKEVNGLHDTILNELVETKIRNTAANILLFFIGEQPKHTSYKNRFCESSPNYLYQ